MTPNRGGTMGYTDSRGRPELIMHPDIKRGTASWRKVNATPDEVADETIDEANDRETPPRRPDPDR